MLHCKAAVVDDTLFLDDRNWPDDGADTIVRDTFASDAQIVRDAVDGKEDRPTPFFSVAKRESLASESRLLRERTRGRRRDRRERIVRGEQSRVQGDRYCRARRRARTPARERARLQGNANEQGALKKLAADGVGVRVCDADEKFAVIKARADGSVQPMRRSHSIIPTNSIGARAPTRPQSCHICADAFEKRWPTRACGFMISSSMSVVFGMRSRCG